MNLEVFMKTNLCHMLGNEYPNIAASIRSAARFRPSAATIPDCIRQARTR